MVTLVVPISRDFLSKLFNSIEYLNCDSIFCYVDGGQELFQKTNQLVYDSKFKNKSCVMRNKGMPNVSSVKHRRQRISDINNELKSLVPECDYIFMLEDDTLPPPNTVEKLLDVFHKNPHTGFASGVELGRWGFPHIGAWDVDDLYDTKRITSVPLESGVREVDAAGLYCSLIKYQTYKNHHFQPYEDILGPDVDFGITLKKKGFKNYIDYSIKCTHLTQKESIEVVNPIQIEFIKEDKWTYGPKKT